MKNLLLAELGRLRSRRLAWVALVGILLAVGLFQIAVYQTVRPLSAPTNSPQTRVRPMASGAP